MKNATRIDDIFSEWTEAGAPGCALGIMRKGSLVYAQGYGLANIEHTIPNSPDSVFRIGSTSKQFTAACVLHLAVRGKLDLDNRLRQYFPDFPAYAEDITIRHLLHHTSGIRDYLTVAYLKGYGDYDYFDDGDIMQWLVDQRNLNNRPGEAYLYSNSGYWLLGRIVTSVAGVDMAEYAEKELFGPLGMSSTHFHNDHTKIVKGRASGYAPHADGSFRISMTTLNAIGDGGIFTTIRDIEKWDNALHSSGALGAQFGDMMTERGTLNSGETIDYAAGLIIGSYKGLKTISHGGAFVGFRAEFMRFPEQRISIAVFANRADANPTSIAYRVADIVLKKELMHAEPDTALARPGVGEPPAPALPLEQLTGTYEIQPGMNLVFSVDDSALRVRQTWDDVEYSVERAAGNTFSVALDPSITFAFSRPEAGFAQLLTIDRGGDTSSHKRIEASAAPSLPLEDFVGDYYSAELDVTYYLSVEEDQLQLAVSTNDPVALTVVKEDQFGHLGSVLRFRRSNGSIIGFALDVGPIKSLKFRKT